MKLQKVQKLDKKVISSVKIYKCPFTSVIHSNVLKFIKTERL